MHQVEEIHLVLTAGQRLEGPKVREPILAGRLAWVPLQILVSHEMAEARAAPGCWDAPAALCEDALTLHRGPGTYMKQVALSFPPPSKGERGHIQAS